MDYIFFTGVTGSLILVTGAAWPDKKVKHPALAIKNWLFAIGGFTMFTYAIIGYLAGGPVFFIFQQIIVAAATVMMMLNVKNSVAAPIVTILGLALIAWSIYIFQGASTIIFILGITGIGLGYTFKIGTPARNFALMLGSLLVAIYSYVEASWIFFWLNTFFAIFSGFYLYKSKVEKRKS